ncbi:MAG: ABC transporter ATP-binding protein [Promethearchaeota archaeon]
MDSTLDIPVFVERNYFAGTRFGDALDWVLERSDREIHAQILGTLHSTQEEVEVEGRIIDVRRGGLLGRTRLALVVENVIKGPSSLKDIVITVGGERTEREDVAAKQLVMMNWLRRNTFDDFFFDGDLIDEAVKRVQRLLAETEVDAHIWGTDKDGEEVYIHGTVTNASIVRLRVALLELRVAKPGSRSRSEADVVTIGGKEIAPEIVRELVSVVPDVLARKMHFTPAYSRTKLETKFVVETEKLTVTVEDDFDIIRDVTFKLPAGQIMGIIGESGSGKSTTIRAILGDIIPTSGRVRLGGVDSRQRGRVKPLFGFVPQDLSYMYQDFSALENIVEFGKQYGIPEEELVRRGKVLLRELGIFEKGNQSVRTLSGGEKRRASIAISMVHRPQLMVLDEPTSGLDPDARSELWEYLDYLNREYGTSMIVVTHYPQEGEFCDKVGVFLREHSMIAYGSPKELKASLPGKGYATGLILKEVRLDLPEILQDVPGIVHILERGELVKIFSDRPAMVITEQALRKLQEKGIEVKSVWPKMDVDLIDYFILVTRRQMTV